MKFVRDSNRVYTIMDFEEGEEIEFAYHPDRPLAVAKGYEFWRSKIDGRTRLLTQEDVKRCRQYESNRND